MSKSDFRMVDDCLTEAMRQLTLSVSAAARIGALKELEAASQAIKYAHQTMMDIHEGRGRPTSPLTYRSP